MSIVRNPAEMKKSIAFWLTKHVQKRIGGNFHNRYKLYECHFCSDVGSQEHALFSNETTQYLDTHNKSTLQTVSYNPLFGTVDVKFK